MQQELLILPNRLSSLLVLVGLVLQASQVDPCLCVRTFVCVWGGGSDLWFTAADKHFDIFNIFSQDNRK
jgi:hypothetical protein